MFIPAPPRHNPRDTYDIDKQRLKEKIINEFNEVDFLEKPETQEPQKVPVNPLPVPVHHHKPSKKVSTESNDLIYNVDGIDQDPTARKRRDKVKEVSTHHHETVTQAYHTE